MQIFVGAKFNRPSSGARHQAHTVLDIPDDATDISITTQVGSSETVNPDYVQVRFPSGTRLYCYRCPGCKVGDYIAVPPSSYCPSPQIVRVIKLGRGTWRHATKDAQRIAVT